MKGKKKSEGQKKRTKTKIGRERRNNVRSSWQSKGLLIVKQ